MRGLFLVLTAFSLGFMAHALLFPDLFSQTFNLNRAADKVLGETQKEAAKSLTISYFKNGRFHPGKIWIKKGYYVGLENSDEDSLMWLESETESLSTVRGYGFGEQLKALLPEEKTHLVKEKNTGASLIIVVQP